MLTDEALAAASCVACRRPRRLFALDLPLGLGRRTYTDECPCEVERREAEAQARRLAAHAAKVRQLLAESGIAARHRTATFETFRVTPATAPVLEACRAFVAGFPDGGRGLTLAGPPGTGKTHLGAALTRALIERGVPAVIVNVPRLFVQLRASLTADRSSRVDEIVDLCCTCEHLVLDDLGRERPTEWVQEKLYLIVDGRYEACLATTVTTNLNPDGLQARLGEAITDRLAETNAIYWCRWPSYRRARRPAEAP